MRSIHITLIIGGLLISVTGCKSSKINNAESLDISKVERAENLDPSIDLAAHLRKLPGVSVINDGGVTKVTMKGFKSFEGHLEPLFVIDGKMFTGGYSAAAGAVDVNDIESIRVIRDINERAQYGFRGANGVIEIKTKSK